MRENFLGSELQRSCHCVSEQRGDKTESEAAAQEEEEEEDMVLSLAAFWLGESFPARFSPSQLRTEQTKTHNLWTDGPEEHLSLSLSLSARFQSDLPYDLFMAIKLRNVQQSGCGIAPFLTLDSGKEKRLQNLVSLPPRFQPAPKNTKLSCYKCCIMQLILRRAMK